MSKLPLNVPGWVPALVESGLVEAAAARTAVQDMDGDEVRVAEALVARGHVSPRDLAVTRAIGASMSFLELNDFRVNLANGELIAEEVARRHTIFPVFHLERTITLAVSRPLELEVFDQIRLRTGCELDQCYATPRDIQRLIDWAYGDFAWAGAGQGGELAWDDILKDVANSPAVRLVDVLLEQAAATRASDVHIDSEEDSLRIRFRIDGVLREVPAPPKTMLPALVSRVKVLAQMDIAETRNPQDGRFKLGSAGREFDVRVSTLPSANGEAVVMRLLGGGSNLISLEELGMDSDCLARFDRLIHLPHGMLLVTGPTGSGKTTTLYSGLTRLDRVRLSIITLENPIEIRLPKIRQVAINVKAGLTFESGLRAILRQDPDCILVGEIRDSETAEIAMQAALTGHLLLSTLHTNSAAAATARLRDMGLPNFLVASSLVGVLAQRLCRRVCRRCAQASAPNPGLLEQLGVAPIAGVTFLEAVGCKRCGDTGYEGRIGIFELMEVDDDIRAAIMDGSDPHSISRIAQANQMKLLIDDGIQKVAKGMTTLEELVRVIGGFHGQSGGGAAGKAGKPGASSVDRPDRDALDGEGYDAMLHRWLSARPASAGSPRENGDI
ncbi:MAG: Flp pilus assembly complex ATPase component TadA [Planctomycetes bacterium]|nr:Flp pilus assembly complex ATPase component TadA [Planctomycetota bacterium]